MPIEGPRSNAGGVDSAVAAARAVDAGHEVVGVHLALSRMPGTLRTGSRGCCTIEDSSDAWRACEKLGIPYYVWDFSERFKADVVDDFIAEYSAGRTPNPCMRCNEKIKFEALLDKAIALGFDAVATGHYAKIIENDDGALRAAPRGHLDQGSSPTCWGCSTRSRSPTACSPWARPRRRSWCAKRPPNAGSRWRRSPIPTTSASSPTATPAAGWLSRSTWSPVRSSTHRVTQIGEHEGSQAYTVGQRRGLKLGRPAPDGKPRFVLEIRPKENTVVAGPKELLDIDLITGIRLSWAGAAVPQAASGEWFSIDLQIRAHAEPVPASARVDDTGEDPQLVVELAESLQGVAPGQTAVMYQGTRVLGQATIDTARSRHRTDVATAS